jgi:uncharacterized UBP type Zn finger protein
MTSEQGMALNAAAFSANGSAPHCEHCQAEDDRPATLLICLSCGWVACSDDSPNQHAKAHYAETDHPIVVPVAPGPAWRWCYVHQRLV